MLFMYKVEFAIQGSSVDYALSIICEHELPEFNFIARNEDDFRIWTDGLHALLGNQVKLRSLSIT